MSNINRTWIPFNQAPKRNRARPLAIAGHGPWPWSNHCDSGGQASVAFDGQASIVSTNKWILARYHMVVIMFICIYIYTYNTYINNILIYIHMYIVIYIYIMNIHNIFFENTDINNQCKPLNTHSILLIWIFLSYFPTVCTSVARPRGEKCLKHFSDPNPAPLGSKGVSLCASERARERERVQSRPDTCCCHNFLTCLPNWWLVRKKNTRNSLRKNWTHGDSTTTYHLVIWCRELENHRV